MAIIWEPQLSTEAAAWNDKARTLTRDLFAPLAAEIDRDQRYPVEHLAPLLASGLSGMFIPSQYGGSDASLTSVVAAVETIAQGCASTSAILAALSLGAFPVLIAGTPEQKTTLLGELARHGHAINFALSERNAGSDPSALQTTAEREGTGWRIRGEKCWLGNGGHSHHFIVFARTAPAGERNNISAFVVARNSKGVDVDFYEDKMGIRGTTTTNLKLDTYVSPDALVGELGHGLKLALATLNIGRIVIAAQANGIALSSFAAARDFATERKAFGHAIIDHQGVGFKLADAATALSSSRMMMYEAARAYDAKQDVSVLGAMAKLLASEVSHKVVDDAVQIFGGRGYVKPNLVERAYRDQRITEIYEGTSEIQRVVLVRAIKKTANTAVAGVTPFTQA